MPENDNHQKQRHTGCSEYGKQDNRLPDFPFPLGEPPLFRPSFPFFRLRLCAYPVFAFRVLFREKSILCVVLRIPYPAGSIFCVALRIPCPAGSILCVVLRIPCPAGSIFRIRLRILFGKNYIFRIAFPETFAFSSLSFSPTFTVTVWL